METDYAFLNSSVTEMINRITSMGGVIDGRLQIIYLLTGVIMLVIAVSKFMWEKSLGPLADFVVRYVQLMGLIAISGNWMKLTEGYVAQMGSFGASVSGFSILQLAPGTVILKAMEIASRMYTENLSWMRLIFGSADDTVAHFLLGLGCIGTILLSIFMAAWIMLFFVIFKVATVVALIFLAFMMFDATRFMAAPGLARILAYGVQMLVLGVAAGLFFMTLEGLDLSGHLEISQSLALLTVMLFFGLLFKYTTDIAREQISGMPSLGLHDIGRGGAQAAMTGASMLGTAAAGALGTFAGMRLSGFGGSGTSTSISSASPSGGSVMASGGGGGMSTIGGGASIPRAAARLLENPNYASWTEARDLPKSAQRLLSSQSRDLPPPPPSVPPPPRALPGPRS
jgi:type IV secretory pathway TrbL component